VLSAREDSVTSSPRRDLRRACDVMEGESETGAAKVNQWPKLRTAVGYLIYDTRSGRFASNQLAVDQVEGKRR
jgi:hypothetical protein